MLLTPGVAAITEDIIGAARRDAAAGFSTLFDRRGRTRVARLSIAFGSKVVHFAGYDYARPRPLVLDARVYSAAQEVAPTAPVPNPAKRTTGEQYRAYCTWAGAVAECNESSPSSSSTHCSSAVPAESYRRRHRMLKSTLAVPESARRRRRQSICGLREDALGRRPGASVSDERPPAQPTALTVASPTGLARGRAPRRSIAALCTGTSRNDSALV